MYRGMLPTSHSRQTLVLPRVVVQVKKALLEKDFEGRTMLIAAARSGSQAVFGTLLHALKMELTQQEVLSI